MQSPKANEKWKTKTETEDQVWIPTGDGSDNSGLYLCEAQRHPAELALSRLLPFQRTFVWLVTSQTIPAALHHQPHRFQESHVWMGFGHLYSTYL